MIRDSQFFFVKVYDCDDAKKYFFRFFFNLDTKTEYIGYEVEWLYFCILRSNGNLLFSVKKYFDKKNEFCLKNEMISKTLVFFVPKLILKFWALKSSLGFGFHAFLQIFTSEWTFSIPISFHEEPPTPE